MKTFRNFKWVIVLLLMAGGFVIESHAGIISNFSTQNPLTFAYPGSTWTTLGPPAVQQFESFTAGAVSGQEVLSLGGGNPTVSGGAGVLGLNLDLSGATALQLTARLLTGNQAALIQVLLFDADGTVLRFSYPTASFNASTFSSVTANFSSAVTAVAGSTPGFDLSHLKVYEVQGDFSDGSPAGTAPFRAQFSNLAAIGTPEPTSGALAALGLGVCFVFVRRFRRLTRT